MQRNAKGLIGDCFRLFLSGIFCGMMICIFAITYSSILFSGNLEAYKISGISLALMGAILLNLVFSKLSSYPNNVAVPQVEPTLILSIISANIIEALRAKGSPELIYPSVMMAIVMSSIALAFSCLFIAHFRLGNIVRFIPYPVIAGFMVAIGWMMMKSGLNTMTGLELSFQALPIFFTKKLVLRWILGISLALAVWFLQLYSSHFLILPAAIFSCGSIFYTAAFLNGYTIDRLFDEHWLTGPLPNQVLFLAPNPELFWQADWDLLLSLFPQFCVLVVVSIISLLLCSSSFELVIKRDIDLNTELKAAGISSIFCALFNCISGYSAFGGAVISHKLGSSSRMVGIITACICAFAIIWGSMSLALIPKAITGGIVFYIGFDLFYEWTIGSWNKFSLAEKLIIALVTFVVILFGFLEGVTLGIFSGLFLFVIDYSQTNIIRFSLDASSYHSHVERPRQIRHFLNQQGSSIFILKLQGYIFFGTANKLYLQIKERANEEGPHRLSVLIIDFQAVTGTDSSAIQTFSKLALLSEQKNFHLVFSSLEKNLQKLFLGGGLQTKTFPNMHYFPDLDFAMEWAEDHLLDEQKHPLGRTLSIKDQLLKFCKKPAIIEDLFQYMEKIYFEKGQHLIHQNEKSQELFFIESGEISVILELEDKENIRLKKMGSGAIVGELTFYLHKTRTASVIAESKTSAYRLQRQALEKMQENAPQSVALMHEYIAYTLSERLVQTDQLLKELKT